MESFLERLTFVGIENTIGAWILFLIRISFFTPYMLIELKIVVNLLRSFIHVLSASVDTRLLRNCHSQTSARY